MSQHAKIYLAGGCFWGTEHFLKQIEGVEQTEVGYANGKSENPTYEEVCHENTDHVETVAVTYNPNIAPLPFILDLFFQTIDPTSVNRQGGDVGRQYRTGIYYTDEKEETVIRNSISKLSKNYEKPIAIEVMPLSNFYPAEKYHQNYLDRNPTGYCHIPSHLFEVAKRAKATDQDGEKHAV